MELPTLDAKAQDLRRLAGIYRSLAAECRASGKSTIPYGAVTPRTLESWAAECERHANQVDRHTSVGVRMPPR